MGRRPRARASSTPTPTCSTRRSRPSARRRSRRYVHWADRFLEEYAARRDDDWRATALDGIAAGLRSGTTCFGDVVTDVAALDVLVAAEVPGVAYLEIIGVDAERWEGGVGAEVTELLTSAPRTAAVPGRAVAARARTASPSRCCGRRRALARRLGLRIHTHLAEIDSEDELYRTGTGVWADRIRPRHDRGWPQFDDGGVGPRRRRVRRRVRAARADSHVAHGVYLGRDGRRLLADAGTSVALCPRSNLTVGIDPPPVADFLREGVPFCVGTDSLGSNASLDLLADVALLRRLAVEGGYGAADLDRRLLAAATVGGAAALGLERRGRRPRCRPPGGPRRVGRRSGPARAGARRRRRGTLHGHRRRRENFGTGVDAETIAVLVSHAWGRRTAAAACRSSTASSTARSAARRSGASPRSPSTTSPPSRASRERRSTGSSPAARTSCSRRCGSAGWRTSSPSCGRTSKAPSRSRSCSCAPSSPPPGSCATTSTSPSCWRRCPARRSAT